MDIEIIVPVSFYETYACDHYSMSKDGKYVLCRHSYQQVRHLNFLTALPDVVVFISLLLHPSKFHQKLIFAVVILFLCFVRTTLSI